MSKSLDFIWRALRSYQNVFSKVHSALCTKTCGRLPPRWSMHRGIHTVWSSTLRYRLDLVTASNDKKYDKRDRLMLPRLGDCGVHPWCLSLSLITLRKASCQGVSCPMEIPTHEGTDVSCQQSCEWAWKLPFSSRAFKWWSPCQHLLQLLRDPESETPS